MTRLLLAPLFAAIPSRVFADIPPPRGYVEECTIANVQKDGEECVERDAWHGDRDASQRYLGDFGYCRRCKTSGASTYGEIYCRQKSSDNPLPSGWRAAIKALPTPSADPDPSSKPLVPECPAASKHDGASPKSRGCGCSMAGEPLGVGASLAPAALVVGIGARRRSRRAR